MNTENLNIKVISDVDGCLTNGQFIYTADGKAAKIFGCGDHEGVKLLRKNNIDVEFITADRTGAIITLRRCEEMGCKLSIISESERVDYLKKVGEDYDMIVFFGDGIGDAFTVKECTNKYIYFVTPQNGRDECKEIADYITPHGGSFGAFLDLALHVSKKFRKKLYVDLYETKK